MPHDVIAATEKLLDRSYLLAGSQRQQTAAEALQDLGLDSILEIEEWVLAGTLPLGIDVDTSDLDILVSSRDPKAARDAVVECFSQAPGLSVWPHSREEETWCVAFEGDAFPIEFFIQQTPVREQRAFRHLVAEYVLLQRGGPVLAEQVHQLKVSGMKTEPAFAHALGLEGDPYLALLDEGLLA